MTTERAQYFVDMTVGYERGLTEAYKGAVDSIRAEAALGDEQGSTTFAKEALRAILAGLGQVPVMSELVIGYFEDQISSASSSPNTHNVSEVFFAGNLAGRQHVLGQITALLELAVDVDA